MGRRDAYVKTKVEREAIQPQAKGHQGSSQPERGEGSPQHLPGEHSLTTALDFGFWPADLWEIKFLEFFSNH